MDSPAPIRVVVLDDHALLREGVRSTLAREPDIVLVGEGSTGEHLELLLARHRPDVVLLDLRMPQREGETTRDGQPFQPQAAVTHMTSIYTETRFLVLSNDCTRGSIEAMMNAGASGYLVKEDRLTTHLGLAIRTVHHGGVCVSPEVREVLSNSPRTAGLDQLSERQVEILEAMALQPNDLLVELAEQLGISESTLKRHAADIRLRLGVRTNTAAILKAVQGGLVSLDTIVLSDHVA